MNTSTISGRILPPYRPIRIRPFSAALLAFVLWPASMIAQQIAVQAGATPNVAVVPNGKLVVPVIVDLSNAGATHIASLQGGLTWNATRLTFDSLRLAPGSSFTLTTDATAATSGAVTFIATSPSVLAATGTLMNAYFTASAGAGGTRILLGPTAAADLSTSVLGAVRPQGLDVCVAQSGKWGDVNSDNTVNIIDAQQIARSSVGLPVTIGPTIAARGDLFNNGQINIIDAQQIARFSVGLSVNIAVQSRINVNSFVPPTVASMLLNPSASQAVGVGSALQLTSTPRDAGNVDLSGCADVTWTSSSPGAATVNASGLVSGIANGSSTITVTSAHNPAVSTSLVVTVGGAAPDLIITAMTAASPATVGGTVSVSATVKNQGTVAATAFRLGFYFSTDPTITTSDTFSGASCAIPPLGANQSITCPGAIPVPSGLAPGTYYVGAIADDQAQVGETDETNNALAAGTTTAVLAATPDLVVDVVTAPGTATIGSTITASATVHNQGATTGQSFRVSFYYSTDATITAADTYSGFSCTISGLASNTTTNCTGVIPVPSALAAGTYYVGAIVDDLAQVAEANENNNATAAVTTTALLTSVPDLLVTAVSAPATGSIGATIAATATIRNQGATTAQSFRVGFYFSTDANITTGDVFSTFACPLPGGLASNTTTTCSGSVPVPSSLAPGTYYVGAIVDDLNQVTEASKTNNALAAATTTVLLASTPDFVVDVVSAPTAATIIGTINVSATVRNQGAATGQSFRVGFYYSTDATITTGDTYSGFSCTVAAGLGPNAASTCTGAMPVPASLAAGPYYVGAVVDDQNQVTEANETNNAMAAMAITTVSAAGTLNLNIDGLYITQATQTYTGTVPLVAGKAAYLRVFVKASKANGVAPDVRVRFYQNGVLSSTTTIPAGIASVPTTITEGVLASSWNLPIAANLIQPGLSVLADVDPTNTVAEADKGDNTFPLSGTPLNLNVQTVPTFDVRFVPIVHTASGLTGNVNNGNAASFTTDAKTLWPIQAVTTNVRTSFSTSAATLDQGSAWNQILSEIDALRVADGSSSYYYGVLPSAVNAAYCGLGYIPGQAAIGTDSCGASTAAHEWGHNFNLLHAPCGGAANPDPNYPYAGASIGAYGFDVANVALKSPATFVDLMSYCSPVWVSDYNYSAVLNFRASRGFSAANTLGAVGPTVLIWGRISNGSIIMEPAFDMVTRASLPATGGPMTVDGFDSRGNRLFGITFAPQDVADSPNGDRHFAFAVPVTWSSTAVLASLRARTTGAAPVTVTSRATAPVSASRVGMDSATVSARRVGASTRVVWNAQTYPMAIIRSATTGEILGFARNGSTDLQGTAQDLEVTFSDGVRSVVQRVRVNQ